MYPFQGARNLLLGIVVRPLLYEAGGLSMALSGKEIVMHSAALTGSAMLPNL